MSLEPYYFRPMTPPNSINSGTGTTQQGGQHSRAVSTSSCLTNVQDSPQSVQTVTPPRAAIFRHCGQMLLPKIRTQDSTCAQPVSTQPRPPHKRVMSSISAAHTYPSQVVAYHRSSTEPVESVTLMSPVSMNDARSTSAVPPSTSLRNHSKAVSTSSIDDGVLSRYGYPTYRQMPVYSRTHQSATQSSQQLLVLQQQRQQHTPSPDMFADSYLQYQNLTMMEAPTINIDSNFDLDLGLESYSRTSSTSPPPQQMLPVATSSLLNYLTQPTQPVNLVRQLTFQTGRGLSSHFWWDVRNVRPWSSFSLQTMSHIPDLFTLLSFQHDAASFPVPAANQTSTVTPASEADLASIINKIYFPKVNTAARLSLGQNCPSFYVAPPPQNASTTISANSHPSFLANYPTDSANRTLTGLPRGRVVGLAKSFDRWNSGMRHEGPAQRVQYLKGLAHLQKCMRDHSCRYGFIITEIELVCVRAGCDNLGASGGVPWFGHLEVAEGIAVKTAAATGVEDSNPYSSMASTPFTVSIALYYLLMLAKATPLPGQPGSFMDVGGPGALTRQKVSNGADLPEEQRGKDGKDKWIPEPQVGEKRDAKTARGWVWPSDPWHKREGGGVGRKGRR